MPMPRTPDNLARFSIAALALASALAIASCSSERISSSLERSSAGRASEDVGNPGGGINVCKFGGPAGTYTFHADVVGGGDYGNAFDHTVDFDGVNPICAGAIYVPVNGATWPAGTFAAVTVSEINLPDGMHADSIIVRNAMTGTDYPAVIGTNAVTVTFAPDTVFYVKFYNGTTTPPPPVIASCYSITVVQGVPLTPTQLSGSGGVGGPYTFSATGLPTGLSLSSTGLLTGTATVTGTFTYTVTVTDAAGTSGSSSCSVTVKPPPPQFCSYTPGGWGAPPNGGNVASILYANWTAIYGSAGVTLGSTSKPYKYAKWTSPTAVTNYLPDGGTPGVYTTNYTNPLVTSAGEFSSQVLALRFNVNFSNAGKIKPGFSTTVVQSGPLAGLTTTQVLALANAAVGGNTSVLTPYGLTVAQLTKILSYVNGAYDNCTTNTGYLLGR